MTHDELLAKLLLSDKTDVYETLRLWQSALYAVVELHKPTDLGWCGCGTGDPYLDSVYPCPTIQAIEKELK